MKSLIRADLDSVLIHIFHPNDRLFKRNPFISDPPAISSLSPLMLTPAADIVGVVCPAAELAASRLCSCLQAPIKEMRRTSA